VTSPKSGLRGKLQLSINTGTSTRILELRAGLLRAAPPGRGCWGRAGCAHGATDRPRCQPRSTGKPPRCQQLLHLLRLLPRPSFYFKKNLLELIYFSSLCKEKIDLQSGSGREELLRGDGRGARRVRGARPALRSGTSVPIRPSALCTAQAAVDPPQPML